MFRSSDEPEDCIIVCRRALRFFDVLKKEPSISCSSAARWARYDLIALDEAGYVPLAEVGAEFLFQVIAQQAEKAGSS